MNKDDIIAKIKKCLALGKSSNEHEAEIAMRQAQKLMEQHGITDQDVDASAAEERRAKAGAKNTPANWESYLAGKIADAFGCEVIFSIGWVVPSEWVFIGCAPAPEIAHYAFDVLHRQAKRARSEHIRAHLKRCGPVNKTRRADLFCEGWVQAVAGKITAFTGTEEQLLIIDAYMAKNYPSRSNLKSRQRNKSKHLSEREFGDFSAGRHKGKDAELNRGMGGSAPIALE